MTVKTFTELSSETDSTLLASVEFEQDGATYFGSVHQAEHVGPAWDKETHVALPLNVSGDRRGISREILAAYAAWKSSGAYPAPTGFSAAMDLIHEAVASKPAQAQMEFE